MGAPTAGKPTSLQVLDRGYDAPRMDIIEERLDDVPAIDALHREAFGATMANSSRRSS